MNPAPDSILGAAAPITENEFESIRSFIHQGFGINLTSEKKALVVGRLQKLLRDKGGITFGEYYRQVTSDNTGREVSELINRISTNHTFFNREKEHFEFFRKTALPEAVARAKLRGSRDIRVWCAAASTGEEPYMLAMIMRDFFSNDFEKWDLGLLATDISEKALEVAKLGIYSEERAAGMPQEFLRKYFSRRKDGDYEAIDRLKQDITYRRFNLINGSFPFKKPFDIIFCRNVMIYFDPPTKDAVVKNMAQFTVPGGHFFIGHSESLGRNTGTYRYLQPALYRKEAMV